MIIKEILNRRSVREYKPDDVPEEYITEIIKAGQFAPSAHNSKAAEFIVIRDKKTKNLIFEIAGQEYVKEAPVLIIPVADTEKSYLLAQDLAVVSENMFLQAAALGLGTVWKHLHEEWQGPIKKLLNIPDNHTIINIVPVGYPKAHIKPHTDDEFSKEKIHKEKWGAR